MTAPATTPADVLRSRAKAARDDADGVQKEIIETEDHLDELGVRHTWLVQHAADCEYAAHQLDQANVEVKFHDAQ